MKKLSKILSAILSVCIIMSVCSVGMVSASGEKVLMSWDGEDTVTNLNGASLSDIMEIKEFQGENVINLRTQKAGRVINYWSMTESRKLNKHLSFQIYVPSTDYYYIDMRLVSSRHSIQGVSPTGNNINTISQFTFVTDANNGRTIIGVKDGVGGSSITKGIYNLDEWHTVDIYINDKKVSYYVDYEHVTDTNVIGTGTHEDGFDHAFKGFQMCIGQDGGTTGTEEGMYIRKVKLTGSAPYLGANILDDNFESYAVDTEITDGTNVTDITPGNTNGRYNNFVSIDANYIKTGNLGFKQLADGNKVFVARNTSDNPRVGGNDMRFAFWRNRGVVDLGRGPIIVEMDINIPDRSKISGVIIQPFANNTANANLEAEVNTGGLTNNNLTGENTRTAYASLLIPCADNALFNLRKDGQIYHDKGADTKGEFYHSKPYTEGTWANLKLIVSKEGDASYKTKVYLNDEYFGEQSTAKTAANALQTAATDNFRGIRFMSSVSAKSTYVEDLYYIDNVKMYLNEEKTKPIYDIKEFKLVDDKGDIIDGTIPEGTETIEAGMFIEKNQSMAYNAQLILAQYDEDGNMIMCGVKELPFKTTPAGSILSAGVKQDLAEGAKTVKAFLWTDTIQPMNIKNYNVE